MVSKIAVTASLVSFLLCGCGAGDSAPAGMGGNTGGGGASAGGSGVPTGGMGAEAGAGTGGVAADASFALDAMPDVSRPLDSEDRSDTLPDMLGAPAIDAQ